MKASVFKFDEPGSRVLREFKEQRARDRLIAQRGAADMKRSWWSGVAGVSNSGFAGAGVSRLTASLAQWSGAVNADLDAGLAILRARARQLCQNNEFGRRFLSLVGANVIGKAGPTLQVRAMTDGGVLDKVANDAIEMAWAQWCARADVRGLMDFAHLQRVGVTSVARDGESLIRVVRNRNLHNGIGLQILEADRLDETLNRTLNNGNSIRQGIEINSLMQPVAYYIKSAHPGDTQHSTPPTVERVPAEQITHAYLPVRAEQVRGYTWLHAVLIRMNMLHAYEEAAVVAARVGAAKMGIFTRKEDAAPALGQIADGTSASGVPQMSAEAGEFMDLTGMPGVSLETWNPEYPHANFDSFLKACFRGVATGLDIATHNLTGDMTEVNYSSARIAELSERDHWEVTQGWWVRTVTLPIFRAWLESALIRGDIRFPASGKALPAEKLQKFSDAARFQARRWQWVDPAKEIEAAEREVALGLRSRTQIAASQGREFEDVVDELKQEKALLEAAGLPWQAGKTQPAPAPTPAAPTEQDDEDDKQNKAAVRTLMTALSEHLTREPQPAAAPVINVDARTTNNLPPAEVTLEATIEGATVNVAPAAVNVRSYPSESVEHIERDQHHEMTTVRRINKD